MPVLQRNEYRDREISKFQVPQVTGGRFGLWTWKAWLGSLCHLASKPNFWDSMAHSYPHAPAWITGWLCVGSNKRGSGQNAKEVRTRMASSHPERESDKVMSRWLNVVFASNTETKTSLPVCEITSSLFCTREKPALSQGPINWG